MLKACASNEALNQHHTVFKIQVLLLCAAETEISVSQAFSDQGPIQGPLNFPTSPKTSTVYYKLQPN